jgi:hypothetical protein
LFAARCCRSVEKTPATQMNALIVLSTKMPGTFGAAGETAWGSYEGCHGRN